jgi:hypothetical protein
MSEEQEPWDKEKAQKYSDMMAKVSKRVYIPFAKRIVNNLGPSKRELLITQYIHFGLRASPLPFGTLLSAISYMVGTLYATILGFDKR